jgi:hypothetical protein
MTADDSSRDDPTRNPDEGGADGDADAGAGVPFDEEAAWRLIVANYGERPDLDVDERPGGGSTSVAPVAPLPEDPPRPSPGRPGGAAFDRSYLDAMDGARSDPPRTDDPTDDRADESFDQPTAPPPGRHDDEHFVPPEPPPVPKPTPARRLAWCGLFLPPLLMLAAVVFGWTFPSWVSLGLVAAFVGGFVFLVATMPRDGGDGWGDGAVV